MAKSKSNAQNEIQIWTDDRKQAVTEGFKTFSQPSLANYLVGENTPIRNLIPIKKVSGYSLQPLFWGSSKIQIAVVSFERKATKDKPAIFQSMGDIVEIVKLPEGYWGMENNPHNFSAKIISDIVKMSEKMLVTLPVGLLIQRGVIEITEAYTTLRLAIINGFGLDASQYAAADNFTKQYLDYCGLYQQFGAVTPAQIAKYVGSNKNVALSEKPVTEKKAKTDSSLKITIDKGEIRELKPNPNAVF